MRRSRERPADFSCRRPGLRETASMRGAGGQGPAVVVGRWRRDGLALEAWLENLLAERGVLPSGRPRNGILAAAEPLLHGLGLLSGKQLGALQAAECVHLIEVDKVLGRLLPAIVEVDPCAHQFAPVGFGHHRVDIGPGYAGWGGGA